jgi:LPXTG-motif cell wall-anchored protein
MTRAAIRFVLGGALVCLTAAVTSAQTATTTTETKKFQIIAVDGNQLVVKLPEGTRELTVPDDFRFNIDGKMLSVHELKPGMSGTANITTKTTVVPVTVTEVKEGIVTKALGTSIIVATGGAYKMFSQSDIDKRGVKIMRSGQPAQISDFRENDRITATIITSKPPRVMTQKEVNATLAASGAGAGAGAPASAAAAPPPAPKPAAAAKPAASAPSTAGAPSSTAATSGGAPRKLPKTASPVPLLGLTGLASLLAGLGLTVRRRRATQ